MSRRKCGLVWELGILMISAVLLGGCVAAAVGVAAAGAVGTYAYVKGELSRSYFKPYDEVWNATVQTLEEMDILIVQARKDALLGVIQAQRVDGKEVDVKVEPLAGGGANVKIRIGTFGDKTASRRIHEKIAAKLKA